MATVLYTNTLFQSLGQIVYGPLETSQLVVEVPGISDNGTPVTTATPSIPPGIQTVVIPGTRGTVIVSANESTTIIIAQPNNPPTTAFDNSFPASASSSTSTPSSGVSSGTPNNGDGSSTNVGAIAGGVVGGLAVIGIVLVAIFWIRWRHPKQKSTQPPTEEKGEYGPKVKGTGEGTLSPAELPGGQRHILPELDAQWNQINEMPAMKEVIANFLLMNVRKAWSR